MSASKSVIPARPVPAATVLYTDILQLVTQNEVLGNISNAAILVKGNQISWVGPASELPSEAAAADTTVSLEGCVVIPGLLNTHHHMYQSLTRCIAQVRPFKLSVFGNFSLLFPLLSLYSLKFINFRPLLCTGFSSFWLVDVSLPCMGYNDW